MATQVELCFDDNQRNSPLPVKVTDCILQVGILDSQFLQHILVPCKTNILLSQNIRHIATLIVISLCCPFVRLSNPSMSRRMFTFSLTLAKQPSGVSRLMTSSIADAADALDAIITGATGSVGTTGIEGTGVG